MFDIKNPPFASLVAAARLDLAASAPVRIEALLRAAQFDDARLTPLVHFRAGRDTRSCVYRDERFELLVPCWARGVRSPIHDYAPAGSFAIIESGRAAGLAVWLHLCAKPLDRCLVLDVARKTCLTAVNHYERSPNTYAPPTAPAEFPPVAPWSSAFTTGSGLLP